MTINQTIDLSIDSRLKIVWLVSSLFLAAIDHLVILLCISVVLVLAYVLNGTGIRQDLAAFISLTMYLAIIMFFGLLEGSGAVRGATIIGLKFVTLALTGIIFFRVTSEMEIIGSLVQFHLPTTIVLSIGVGFMSIPIIKKEAYRVLEAQSARGVTLRPRRKAIFNLRKIIFSLLIPLFIRIFDRIFKLYISLRLRGGSSGFAMPNKIKSGSKFGNSICVIYIIVTIAAAVIV